MMRTLRRRRREPRQHRRAVDGAARARLARAHPRPGATSSGPWRPSARSGMPTFNLDIIYGAAGETSTTGDATVEAVLALDPPHVSAYGLTVEAGTPLAAQPDRHPDDDDQADKYEIADDLLAAAGLRELRGVELGAAGPRVPAQPPVLAPGRLPRLRLRRPLAPGRPALVERAHARALHRSDRRRGSRPSPRPRCSTTRPRASRGCS